MKIKRIHFIGNRVFSKPKHVDITITDKYQQQTDLPFTTSKPPATAGTICISLQQAELPNSA